MQYLLCPRCKFRVPANRHLCTTCGNRIPDPPRAVNSDRLGSGGEKLQKIGFWQQFLGITSPEQERKEAGHDGAALGET